jgi:hypothetical protein
VIIVALRCPSAFVILADVQFKERLAGEPQPAKHAREGERG